MTVRAYRSALLGISDLTLADVANYRMAFLGEASGSVNLPTVVVDGNDPGLNAAGGEAVARHRSVWWHCAQGQDLLLYIRRYRPLFRTPERNIPCSG